MSANNAWDKIRQAFKARPTEQQGEQGSDSDSAAQPGQPGQPGTQSAGGAGGAGGSGGADGGGGGGGGGGGSREGKPIRSRRDVLLTERALRKQLRLTQAKVGRLDARVKVLEIEAGLIRDDYVPPLIREDTNGNGQPA